MANQQNIVGTTSGDNIKLENVVLDVWSQEILFTATPMLRFESIARKQTELGVMPGKKIQFLRYASLTGSYVLTETTAMETGSISTSTLDIEVGERGKALAFSEFLLRSAADQVLARAATLLGQHYAIKRDEEIRDSLMSGSNIIYAQGKANRAALDADDYFNVDLIRDAVEQLATNKAPKFGDAYVCFVHPHQARRLRSDNAWINVQNYASPENMLTGEIGRIEDVRFIETTQIQYIPAGTQDIFSDGVDSGANTSVAANAVTDVYRSVIVGDYAVGIAESLPVEMRDNGVQDFGRKHSIAYYGIWGVDLIETGHSLILETA
jgi:N4-gp56 family major capsid protein